MQAVLTGQITLSGKDLRLTLSCLDPSEEDFVPTEVSELFECQPEIQLHLRQALVMHLNDENCAVPKIIQLWKSLAVPAGKGIQFGDWPMYTRACRSFHGRKWYGSVSIQMEEADVDPVTSFGQLRLLISCEVLNEGGKNTTKHLAFVRLMEKLPRDRDWKLMRCTKLKWVDEVVAGTAASTSRKPLHRTPKLPYIVVDVASIAKVVQVVPNFAQVGTYFENRFKL